METPTNETAPYLSADSTKAMIIYAANAIPSTNPMIAMKLERMSVSLCLKKPIITETKMKAPAIRWGK